MIPSGRPCSFIDVSQHYYRKGSSERNGHLDRVCITVVHVHMYVVIVNSLLPCSMPYEPHSLVIHIDGSCYDNPGGSGGIAGIAEYPDKTNLEPELIFQQGFYETTNQRMELRSCIEALEWIRRNAPFLDISRIVIASDSRYLCNNHNRVRYWKKDKWFSRDGRPIENADLWKRIHQLKCKITIRLEINRVPGKSDLISKQVDRLAKEAAKGSDKSRDQGFEGGELSRTRIKGAAASTYQASGNEAVIRIYRKSFIFSFKRRVCKIFFETIVEGTGTAISKSVAYCDLSMEFDLHRHHFYRVRFNDNPRYPRILNVLDEVFYPTE